MIEIKRKTILNDEDYLRQISKEVNKKDKYLKRNIKLLDLFCEQTECFALAAVQIGIPKRIIYLKNTSSFDDSDKKHNERKILINPKIISMKGHTRYWEACLSCLDYMGLVDRPYQIIVEYYDKDFKEHTEIFAGFPATILCHEIDHLDGVLHIDKAIEVLKMNKEDRKVFRDSHPYEIISEN